jgi:hypothetical protein
VLSPELGAVLARLNTIFTKKENQHHFSRGILALRFGFMPRIGRKWPKK